MNGADLDRIKADLADHAEALLLDLFGQPTQKSARWWRWGRKGSLSYRFDRHTFYDFETCEGGGLLDAIMRANGCSFPQAIRWAQQWLGEGDAPRPKPREKRAPYDADGEVQRAIAEAVALWRAGRGIAGTAATRYLQGRAIDGWPADCVRFIGAQDVARIVTSPGEGKARKAWSWWRWPALVFPLTNDAGDVTAVQLIALQDDGQAVPDFDGAGKLKRVRGSAVGTALRLPGDTSGPLVIAEGGETALSLWLATGHETWASLGSIGRAPLDGVPKARAIVAARDDDKRKPRLAPSLVALNKAIAAWRADGRRVLVAQPWPLSRGDKSDFNDVLQADGPDAVRERIEAALRPQDLPQGRQRADATMQLAAAVGGCMAGLLSWSSEGETPAPFRVIRATLGLGKSQAALQAIVDAIGDERRIIYSVPTHALAAELAERAQVIAAKRGRAISVRVWHGREADDPDNAGQAMCRDLAPVKLAQQARLDVLETVCKGCSHKAACSYLAQRQAKAELWLVPHALLFAALPASMAGASALVVDEGFALDGLIGLQGRPVLVPLDMMQGAVTAGSGRAERSADLNAILAPVRALLVDAVKDHPASEHGEPLQRAALVEAGLTVEAAREAAQAERRQIREIDAIKAPTRAELMKALRAVQVVNSEAVRRASLWQHVAAFLADDGAALSGRVELVETVEAGGEIRRAFRLYGVERIGKGWRDLPTMHLDATADMDLLRLRVPHAELVASVIATEPNVTVHQYVGRTFGKGALHGSDGDDARRFAVTMAAEHGGRWLAVASKDAAAEWRDNVPPYVELAHWGAVRGLDTFNDVAGVVCVGRWGVGPNDVGRMAAILTGRAVPRVEGWYPVEACTVTAADGSARTVDAERHPDLLAEAVRRSLVEAELLQAIGRGRGVQRTAGNPLLVLVLGNVPLPVPLASVTDWQPVHFDRAMLADHGAVLASDSDAAEVIGKTRNAVKLARRRLGSGPYINLLKGHDPNLSAGLESPASSGQGADLPESLAAVTYQRRGAGWSETRMIYDRRRIPDPRWWLEARFGPLAAYDGPEATDDGQAVQIAQAPMPASLDELPQFPDAVKGEAPPDRVSPVVASFGLRMSVPAERRVTALAGALLDGPPWSDMWPGYVGGLMPSDLVAAVRSVHRRGLSADSLADALDLTASQFAEALSGRLRLSRDAAVRLRSTLADISTQDIGP